MLQHYCGRFPRFVSAFRKGTYVPFFQVMTRSYPQLMSLYRLFYTKIDGKMVKVITLDILPYLNPISLAYWAMDDGAAGTRTGFYLHTNGFTFEESYLLAGMLHYQFGLVCTVQKRANQPTIYITAKSMGTFRSIVTPHFHTSMMYKITPPTILNVVPLLL
jgi:hypothetical protein